MTAILGTWNPALAPWPTRAVVIAATGRGEATASSWSVANRRHGVHPGDRFYLLKVGKPPRGMVGRGTILTQPYAAPHWDGTPGKMTRIVEIEFDSLVESDQALPVSVLSDQLPHTNWRPQSSGTTVHPADEAALERLWQLHLDQL